MPTRIPFKQKIILVIFGVFFSLVFLEASLHLGGFILLSIQERWNLQSIRQKGAYRILCLGESTTQGQYPLFLEQALNQHNIGRYFSVIDKGRGGTNTQIILNQVEAYLKEYHPDMVVAMMGVNDPERLVLGETKNNPTEKFSIRSFKTYKLVKLLWLHILVKAQEIESYKHALAKQYLKVTPANLPGTKPKEDLIKFIPTEESLKKRLELYPKDDNAYVRLGQFYRKQDKLSQAEDTLKKAIEFNPKNSNAYSGLGWLYRKQKKYSQAEDAFKKAIELNPKNHDAYLGLGQLYRHQDKFSQAEDAFKKAVELDSKNEMAYLGLGGFYQVEGKFSQAEDAFKKAMELNPKNKRACFELEELYQEQYKFSQTEESYKRSSEFNPKNDNAYVGLGLFYRSQEKFSQAEDAFKKAIELNPKNDNAYVGLGQLYRNQGKLSQAEDAFKKAIELNPKNDDAYVGLGQLYRSQGKFSQAEAAFKKAIEVNPKNGGAYGALSVLYQEMGKPELAEEYARKAKMMRLGYCNAVTFHNYHKLKEILDKRGIQLVCVQYPMRNVELLKIIFEPGQGIIFVDNESIFKEAVNKSSYSEYFADIFGGDFGHCTEKGNRLLAGNIAKVILKEIFGK